MVSVQTVKKKFLWSYIFRHFTSSDIFVIIAILLSALISFFYIFILKTDKTEVQIYVNNVIFASVPLRENTTVLIDSMAVVEVIDHKARILSSNCKDRLCVKQGWSDTMPVVCAPNKIMLKFSGEDLSEPDIFITY
jgi:hypothetical protein